MIAIMWRYEVKKRHRPAFEAAYGPAGEWAQLFARGDGYRGTELLRAEDGSYCTIDAWRSREDFDSFLANFRSEYDALDGRTEPWTKSEERVGQYEFLG
jgi:heme-degrading monooxygenase HmoA